MPRGEVIARAVEARKRAPITAVESRARFDLLERLLTGDVSHAALVRIMRERFPGMSESAVERTKTRVLKAWAEESAERTYIRKAQARRRLLRLVARAMRAGRYREVIAAEALLCRIDGLIAPQRVQVAVNGIADPVNAALVHVLGTMSPEQRDELVAEYDSLTGSARSAAGSTSSASPMRVSVCRVTLTVPASTFCQCVRFISARIAAALKVSDAPSRNARTFRARRRRMTSSVMRTRTFGGLRSRLPHV
jgi:hypothetical protein